MSPKRIESPEAAYRRLVRNRNRRFLAMTSAQKRVKIARDVLKQIDTGLLVPLKGVYCYVKSVNTTRLVSDNAQEALNKGQISCCVCALGAVFVITVQQRNNMETEALRRLWPPRLMREWLSDIFSIEQLRLIEQWFEGWDEAYHWARRHTAHNETVYDTAGLRMQLIMQNIIDNKGDFKPELLP